MPYRFVEGLTVADIAFEATGKTLEEMFASAADAMMNTQVDDLKKIELKKEKDFIVKAPDVEKLLYNFLEELIFYKDAEQLIFARYELKAERGADGYTLSVKAKGEMLSQKKHTLVADVKAVSWHKFKVEKTKEGWKAIVIVDV